MKYIEISKKNNDYNVWDEKRIKGAFNNGQGTEKDFKNYMGNNKNWCKFKKID